MQNQHTRELISARNRKYVKHNNDPSRLQSPSSGMRLNQGTQTPPEVHPLVCWFYAIWGYPKVIFMEIKISVTFWNRMLMSYFFTASRTLTSSSTDLLLLKWPLHHTEYNVIVSVTDYKQKTNPKHTQVANKQCVLSVPPAFHVSNYTNWLPFTDTHSHLLAQAQLLNFSPLTTREKDMANLSEHSAYSLSSVKTRCRSMQEWLCSALMSACERHGESFRTFCIFTFFCQNTMQKHAWMPVFSTNVCMQE